MVSIPRGVEEVYVIFTGAINQSTAEALIGAMSDLANLQVKRVHMALSTPGGSVSSGIALYNVLRGLPFELITYNIGNVDSIGNVVYLAGIRRYTDPHATFMFHGVSLSIEEESRMDEKSLKELLDSVLSDQARIGSIIARRSNRDDGFVAELFSMQQTMDAAWAVANGIAHDIREFNAPAGSPILSIVYER